MPRAKKQAPNHATGMYEYKATIGKDFMGKPIRKSFYSSKSVAEAKAKAQAYIIEQEVADRTGETFIQKEYTFAQWAEKWLEVYKKPTVSENTYRLTYKNSVEKHLNPYFGAADLKSIKSIDVQNFFAQKQKTCSESLLDKLRITLNDIFATAIDNDLCFKNPVKRINYTSEVDKHDKHVYSDEQIEAVSTYMRNRMPEICFMLETGARRGEMLGLMWQDIDFEKRTVFIQRAVVDKAGGGIDIRPPKWDSYRTIPISTDLAELLASLNRKSLYVFPNAKNNIYAPHTWSKRLKTEMEAMNSEIGAPILTAHELRHTRGTQLRRQGVDIYTIQKIMGHKDINVTANIYVHDETETTRKAAKII